MRLLLHTGMAFSDPKRVRIILALRTGELCVCELCDALGVVQSTLSTHLQFLRHAGLVATRQEGKWIYYALTPTFARTVSALNELYREELATDPQLRRDAQRLARRMKLREQNECCVGHSLSQDRRRRPATARGRKS